MIQFIKGKIVEIGVDSIVVLCHDIGYSLYFKQQSQIRLNQELTIYTYLALRQDDISLFGFVSRKDLDIFLKLLKVKGIGPKSAQNLFAQATSDRIIAAIESSDVTFLKSLPGIGSKAASQLVLDLKGKLIVNEEAFADNLTNIAEAISGLKGLGYKPNELSGVEKVLKQHADLSVEALIKLGLQHLTKLK